MRTEHLKDIKVTAGSSLSKNCFKYELSKTGIALRPHLSKESWRFTVKKQVNKNPGSTEFIVLHYLMYISLPCLHVDDYRYGKTHSVLHNGYVCEIFHG